MKKLNCSYFNTYQCRSCSLLELPLEEGVSKKIKDLHSLFSSILESNVSIKKCFSPSKVFHSRSKAKLSVSGDLVKPIVGLINKDYKGIELLECPLHLQNINKLYFPVIYLSIC